MNQHDKYSFASLERECRVRDRTRQGGAMTAQAKRVAERGQAPTLPTVGMSRWDTLSYFVPISRESWRKLVIAGKAPQPVRLSERCTMYSNEEVHRWLADPKGYEV